MFSPFLCESSFTFNNNKLGGKAQRFRQRNTSLMNKIASRKSVLQKTHSLHPSDVVQGFWISQQAFCNAKFAFVRTNALLATTMRPFCPQFVIFRLEKKAMAKTKAEEKALNLDQILFNCRDYLRAARNSGSFFEKRDIPRSTAPKFSKRSWNR